jgi:hypothetical protein
VVNSLPYNCDVYPRLYPRRISDVYVEDITTIIGKSNPKLSGAREFGDYMIWNGVSLCGFAQFEKDIY